MKKVEIERKFLLYPCSIKKFLKSNGIDYKVVPIEQFYIYKNSGKVLRYRKKEDRYFLTIKKGFGLVRSEYEIEIKKCEYEKAFDKSGSRLLEKKRFIFKIDRYIYELDCFKKSLKGLNILEVEFEDKEDAKKFNLPYFLEKILVVEVTQNLDFSNQSIYKTLTIPIIKTPLPNLLKRVDKKRDFLKASIEVEYRAYDSSLSVLQTIIYSLLKTIEQNRSAILNSEYEPERVHQLRVSMRKVRAIFAVCKDSFEPNWLLVNKKSIQTLMKKTSRLRDLDVYIEKIDTYKELLPKELHIGLNNLYAYLISQQKREKVRIKELLESKEYLKKIKELQKFALDDTMDEKWKNRRTPVVILAKRSLWECFKKIIEEGRKIDLSSDAKKYHKLRIKVKKLRYMLELFKPILDKSAYSVILDRLKVIQTVLGEHQDLNAQREHLKDFSMLNELSDDKSSAALIFLRKKLYELQKQKRKEFRREFQDFLDRKYHFEKLICK